MPLLSVRYFGDFLYWLLKRPLTMIRIGWLAIGKSHGANRLKNAIVLPKASYVARVLRRHRIDHVHAHWATTPATLALFSAALADVPWSMTAHRHDIAERNLLDEKTRSASFVRVISDDGLREYAGYLCDVSQVAKLQLLHMGVDLPAEPVRFSEPNESFVFVVPAALEERKGHAYLLQALAQLRGTAARPLRCMIIGVGPLDEELRTMSCQLGLNDSVEFLGRLPHDKLLELYRSGEVDAVVLPSVTMSDGEREGIPVSLIEAMSHGLPVIATPTGGTAELVEGAGILVPERDSAQLADALNDLASRPGIALELSAAGRRRVEKAFDVEKVVASLESLWLRAGYPSQHVEPAQTVPQRTRLT
jgi:glycosyltransferase involved in cell wall biosynthesis